MKYYKWKTKWSVNQTTGQEEGFEPTSFVNDSGLTFITGFRNKDVVDRTSIAYGVSSNSIDTSKWTDYFLEEITATEILDAAKEINPESFLDSDGVVFIPYVELPTL